MYDVKLYPEDGETTTILNIKRGIISALAVPLMDADRNKIMVHKTKSVQINEKLLSVPSIIDPKGFLPFTNFSPPSTASATPSTPSTADGAL